MWGWRLSYGTKGDTAKAKAAVYQQVELANITALMARRQAQKRLNAM